MKTMLNRPHWGTTLLCSLLLVVMGLSTGCSSRSEKAIFQRDLNNITAQVFTLDMADGAILKGKEGTILAIPAGAFLDENGTPVSGTVNVQLKEARDLATMFKSGLQTVSDKGLLSTDGSYEVLAFQNDQPLTINPEVGVFAYFPTDAKDPDMRLYAGAVVEGDVKWTVTQMEEQPLTWCDQSKANTKKCKGCNYLKKMAKKGKLNKKPSTNNEYWAKRHYWENGILYYYSSGSSVPVMSKKRLEDCREYLASTKAGQQLLANIDQVTKDQLSNLGKFYAYKLNDLGWYNIDKLVKQELITFSGTIVDEKGEPVEDATIHLFSKSSKVHVVQESQKGSYTFQYQRGASVLLYAYSKDKIGKRYITAPWEDKKSVDALAINSLNAEKMDSFMAELN